MPVLTVVSATHNRPERLSALLAALAKQDLQEPFEVVVVEDGSTDATKEVVERIGETPYALTLLRQEPARGAAAARNRGWKAARAGRIAFTDDDCRPAANWLSGLLRTSVAHPEAIVQGRTLPDPDDEVQGRSRSIAITGPTPHFETCNILYPRVLLERTEGFREEFRRPVGEDGDLGWRARALGAESRFADEAVVFHAVHPESAKQALRRASFATDDVMAYRDNAGLRRLLLGRVLYKPTHALLVHAALVGLLVRRYPGAVLLWLPYLRDVLRRTRSVNAPLPGMAVTVAFDIAELASTIRGAVRHRVLIV